jgi:hypothetical protein
MPIELSAVSASIRPRPGVVFSGKNPDTVKSSKLIPSLDGMRAISILLVMLAHASVTYGFPASVPTFLTEHGLLGVQVFFALVAQERMLQEGHIGAQDGL